MKYVEDRLDNLSNCDHHGSDRVYDVELAVTARRYHDGPPDRVVDDYGAYIQFGSGTTATRWRRSSGPTGSTASSTGCAAVLHEQVPAGRVPGLRLRGATTGCSSGSSTWPPGSSTSTRSRCAGATSSADEFPLLHPDRQRVRLRRLRGRARQGARARRPRPLARRAGEGARGGAVHRHRPRHLPGAQRLQRHRVLVLVRRAGRARDLDAARASRSRVDATGGDHGDAVLVRVLGQQPGDDGRPARRRGVRLRAARRQRSSTPARATGCRPPAPAAAARR